MDQEEVPLDKLVRIYMKMRTKLSELDAEVEGIKEQQQLIKTEIKDRMRSVGAKSMKTEYGTVSLTEKTRYYTQDWDSFKRFVIENDAVDLLEKRIAQTNMKLFLQENPTLVPPGLNSDTEIDVSIRKAAA
jgi:hypothetical protein